VAVRKNGSVLDRLLEEIRGKPREALRLAAELGLVAVPREEFSALVAEVRNLAHAVHSQGLRLEEHSRRLEEHSRRIEELARAVHDQGRRIEDLARAVQEQGQRIEVAFRHVDALGARWGFKSEAAFRNGLREVLSRRFGATVERWQHEDTSGEVFGVPSPVELDVVVRDREPLLIEVKSHVGAPDIAAFRRKADLYDRLHGTRSSRLVVSPSVDERAAELAARVGIGISTDLG
jgi:hypothetical protein